MISEVDIRDMQEHQKNLLEDYRICKGQAEAWLTVVETLKQIDPNWSQFGQNGIDCACLMIKHLARKAGYAGV